MFRVYVDDSGTSPDQHIALATALVIPANQIVRLESEWDTLLKKESFPSFHTSKCLHANPAQNPKSEFKNWDELKRHRVFARVRQIARKYGSRCVSIAVRKDDYESLVPAGLRTLWGEFPYTWAVRQAIACVGNFVPPRAEYPRQFIFDRVGNKATDAQKLEIERVMCEAHWLAEEQTHAYSDFLEYGFRNSKDEPGLQCADAVSWIAYRNALRLLREAPDTRNFVLNGWNEFGGPQGDRGWLVALTIIKQKLQRMVQRQLSNKEAMQVFSSWKTRSIVPK